MITIYGQTGCSFCAKAVDLCKARNASYEYKDISSDVNRSEFKKNFPKATTVPQIMIDGLFIGGYSDLLKEL